MQSLNVVSRKLVAIFYCENKANGLGQKALQSKTLVVNGNGMPATRHLHLVLRVY